MPIKWKVPGIQVDSALRNTQPSRRAGKVSDCSNISFSFTSRSRYHSHKSIIRHLHHRMDSCLFGRDEMLCKGGMPSYFGIVRFPSDRVTSIEAYESGIFPEIRDLVAWPCRGGGGHRDGLEIRASSSGWGFPCGRCEGGARDNRNGEVGISFSVIDQGA